MQIKCFDTPVPHIIIDNFLGTSANHEILKMISILEDQLIDAEIVDHGIRRADHGFRKNLNLWLDTFDDTTMGIISLFTEKFFHPGIEQAVRGFPELNHVVGAQSRYHNMVLSRFYSTDFYKWHTDGGGHVTWNYFCYKEPKKFTGGDFELSDGLYQQERTNTRVIECVNDRLVIFPAKYQHQVVVVNTDNILEGVDCRHSIQVFFSL